MLKSEQISELLKNVPKGFLKPGDDFFVPINTVTLSAYKKLGAIKSEDIESLETPSSSSSPVKEIFCNVFGCNLVFDNVASYQSHYNSMHRFTCSECKKNVPTEHLLDLHVSEQHDSYFQARLERGEPLYKCYVEECKDMFLNASERKDHCIEKHKYPANYRFDQPPNKHTGAVPKKVSTIKAANCMETDEREPTAKRKVLPNIFSFGHQERTFQLKSRTKRSPEQSREALENLDTLKEALSLV